jgi:hypothetical protein
MERIVVRRRLNFHEVFLVSEMVTKTPEDAMRRDEKGRNGRHVRIRTGDLFDVNEAL